MSQEEINNLFGGFEKMAKQMQDAVVDSWSGMTKQAVGSDGFSAASSAYLDWTLASQKQVRSNSAQFLDALEFPKRSDIARVSKQISNAETRIADCEDTLDKILKVLQRLEAKVDAATAAKSAGLAPAASAAQAAAVVQAVAEPAAVPAPAPGKKASKKPTVAAGEAPPVEEAPVKAKEGRAKKHSAVVAKNSARAARKPK